MKRKKPLIVARVDGDKHTLMPFEEWKKPKATPKIKTGPYTGTDELAADDKAGRKIKHAAIRRDLELGQALAEFEDRPDDAVRYRVARKNLFRVVDWARASGKSRKGKKVSATEHSQWQKIADEIWKKIQSFQSKP